MPATTYLSKSDCDKETSNVELNDLLAEVRKATNENWQLTEIKFTELTGLFGLKRKPRILYNLYMETIYPEFQIINFYRNDTGTSINECVDANTIAAYLYGILAGVHSQKIF